MKNKQQSIPLSDIIDQLLVKQSTKAERILKISGDYLQTQYKTAKSLETDSKSLSVGEQQRFQSNCEFIKACKISNELRDYILWEMYSTNQYRESAVNFEAFAMELMDCSSATVWRSVEAGRIRLAFIDADLESLCPKGNGMIELSKVQPDHTIKAWLNAVEKMREYGSESHALARRFLEEYCMANGIQFGKRAPNGSGKLNLPKLGKSKKKNKLTNKSKPSQTDCPWELRPSETASLLDIYPLPAGSNPEEHLGVHIMNCINAIRSVTQESSASKYESSRMQKLLALVARHEPEAANALLAHAFSKLEKHISKAIADQDPTSSIRDGESNENSSDSADITTIPS